MVKQEERNSKKLPTHTSKTIKKKARKNWRAKVKPFLTPPFMSKFMVKV
jgi:hypothetical protein